MKGPLRPKSAAPTPSRPSLVRPWTHARYDGGPSIRAAKVFERRCVMSVGRDNTCVRVDVKNKSYNECISNRIYLIRSFFEAANGVSYVSYPRDRRCCLPSKS